MTCKNSAFIRLLQGLNLVKRLRFFHFLPVGHQLVFVLVQPFINHIEGSAGELSLHGTGCDVNCGLEPLILHVEVRWVVVAEEHRDDDSVECADFRHIVRSICLSEAKIATSWQKSK